MRSPDELAHIDWTELAHDDGCAENVPELVLRMYSADDALSAEAEDELSAVLPGDDTVHSATPVAIPFLVHAVRHLPARRTALLQTLIYLAHVTPRMHSLASAVRRGLEDAVTELLPLLDDPDPVVRRTVVHLAALVGAGVREAAVPALAACYQGDPLPGIRADALTALARVDPDPASVAARESEGLQGPTPAVRVAAALLRLERTGPPYDDAAVEVLADHGDADPEEEDHGFPSLGTRRQRISAVLPADPDAALLTAAHWISRGDRLSHGSRLADQVARTWRDREAEVVDCLVTALPHHRDSSALLALLGDLASWIPGPPAHPGAPERSSVVGSDLPAVLLRYAEHPNPAVSRAAVTALACCGDERALDHATAPGLLGLVAFARDPRALPRLRTALRFNDRGHRPEHLHACRLLEALSPELAIELVPEIAGLLELPYPQVPAAAVLGGLGPRVLHRHPEIPSLLAAAMKQRRHLGQRSALAVAHVRLTGEFDSRTLPTLQAAVVYELQAAEALDAIALLGPMAEPLLPQLTEARGPQHRTEVRMAAAAARWRVTGDPEPEVSCLMACLDASVGDPRRDALLLRALLALVEIGSAPARLHPLLEGLVGARRRTASRHGGAPAEVRMDEQLRHSARKLLDL